jgi:hypothetical protein
LNIDSLTQHKNAEDNDAEEDQVHSPQYVFFNFQSAVYFGFVLRDQCVF